MVSTRAGGRQPKGAAVVSRRLLKNRWPCKRITGMGLSKNETLLVTTGQHLAQYDDGTQALRTLDTAVPNEMFGTVMTDPRSDRIFVRVNSVIAKWCPKKRCLEWFCNEGGRATDPFTRGVEGNPIIVNTVHGFVRIGKSSRHGSIRLRLGQTVSLVETATGSVVLYRDGTLRRASFVPSKRRSFAIPGAQNITSVPGPGDRVLVGATGGRLFLVDGDTVSLFWQHGREVPRAVVGDRSVFVAAGPNIFELYGGLFPARLHTAQHARSLKPHERAAAVAVLAVARRADALDAPTPRGLRGVPFVPGFLWRHILDLAGTLGRPLRSTFVNASPHSLSIPTWV